MALSATELRIGNYLYNDNVVVKIDARTIFDIWDDKGLKNYKPIPLTEEWLIKLGFEINEPNDFYSFKHTDFYGNYGNYTKLTWYRIAYDNVDDNDFTLSFATEDNTFPIMINLYYVHQLQNIYFILTSRELKLKQLI